MGKKSKKSPWGAFKEPKKPSGYISTNVPINRMDEVEDGQRKAMGRLAHDAWSKEKDILSAQGPFSTPEPHYSKTITVPLLKKEKE